MRQIRQNLRSTKGKQIRTTPDTAVPRAMTIESTDSVRQNEITIQCMEMTSKIFSDQTGRFPKTSSKGAKYVMIVYDYDSNAILAEALKSRAAHELLRAMTVIHEYLKQRGLRPSIQILDNECPDLIKQYFTTNKVKWQLVPPNLHRNNAAEKAIGTFKDHLITIICSCDPHFPLHLWCRLLKQATTTLNLLRQSRINPRLSAEAQLNGAFDYNATPLAPPGTKVVVYENPDKRRTWAPHGVDGWYLGAAPEHYRCHTVYITKTRAERIARTVEFFPHDIMMPATSSTDNAITAARMLAEALLNPIPASPFITLGTEQMRAVSKLAELFQCTIPAPIATTPEEHSRTLPTTPPSLPRVPTARPPTATSTPPQLIGATSPRVQVREHRAPLPTSPRVQVREHHAPSPTQTRTPVSLNNTHPVIIPNDNTPPPRTRQRQPLPPPRPHPLYIPLPKQTYEYDEPAAPALIEPDYDDGDDNPRAHRYPLRSQQFRRESLPYCNAVIAEATAISTEYLVPSIHEFFTEEHQCNAVIDEATGISQEYRHLLRTPAKKVWETALANDLGRLAQGVGTRMPKGNSTIRFVARKAVPQHKKVTYARLVAELRPHKKEVHRVRVTVGGDRLDYTGITATQTASLTTTKCLINSTLSTKNAKFMSVDIKDYYYGTIMTEFEYMRMALRDIPNEIIQQYNLNSLQEDGWVYIQIEKGMPGLKQAGKIANDKLKLHMRTHGYIPCERTPALWRHITRPTIFTLVVDDFGIKYGSMADANHLINALRELYEITIDWTGKLYCGLTLDWDYFNRRCTLSMPNYIVKALHKFQHQTPSKPQHAPHAWNKPIYGATRQFAPDADESPKLTPPGVKKVQEIVGTLLYYALAIDNTLLVALGDLASAQAQPTEQTWDKIIWILNYAATHPNAEIQYQASDMCLQCHSDASYLSAPQARSRASGFFFLSDLPTKVDPEKATLNGAIHINSKIIKNVMGSAAEAEIGANYMNGQDCVPIRQTLEEMGHPQPPTPIQVDNTTAVSFAHGTMKQKKSKSIDMNFYWIQDRKVQGQFQIYWAPGRNNYGDYHSKHHSPAHHKQKRSTYLHTEQAANHLAACLLQGCAKPRHIAKGVMHILHPQGLTYNRIHRAKCGLTTRAENQHAYNHSSLCPNLIS